MTISSTRNIAGDRAFPAVQSDNSEPPPPKLYEPADFSFKGYRPSSQDGYKQSAATPGESAIVIDNGEAESVEDFGTVANCLTRRQSL